jgi:hypothetical protein
MFLGTLGDALWGLFWGQFWGTFLGNMLGNVLRIVLKTVWELFWRTFWEYVGEYFGRFFKDCLKDCFEYCFWERFWECVRDWFGEYLENYFNDCRWGTLLISVCIVSQGRSHVDAAVRQLTYVNTHVWSRVRDFWCSNKSAISTRWHYDGHYGHPAGQLALVLSWSQ